MPGTSVVRCKFSSSFVPVFKTNYSRLLVSGRRGNVTHMEGKFALDTI